MFKTLIIGGIAILYGITIGWGFTLRQHTAHHRVEEAVTQEVGDEFCSFGYLKFDTQFDPIEGPFRACYNARSVTLDAPSILADGEHQIGGQ